MLIVNIRGNRKVAAKINKVFPFNFNQVIIELLRICCGEAFYQVNNLAGAAKIEI